MKAVEVGVKYARGNFASNVNAYRTGWENKPVNRFYGVSGLWQDPTLSVYADTSTVAGRESMIALAESNGSAEEWGQIAASVIDDVDRNLGYNLLNADAVHSGIEWDFAFDPSAKLNVQGVVFCWQLALDKQRACRLDQPYDQWIHHAGRRWQHRRHLGEPRRGQGGRCGATPNFFGGQPPDPSAARMFRTESQISGSTMRMNFSPGDVITEGEPKDVWVTPSYAAQPQCWNHV